MIRVEVRSEVAGWVVSLGVFVGDSVEKGLAILMGIAVAPEYADEYYVFAPVTGEIISVDVNKGTTVVEGQLLAVIGEAGFLVRGEDEVSFP